VVGALFGGAMQKDQGLAPLVLQYLDLAPHQANEARAEGLRGGLFSGEARRELRKATPADALFVLRPDVVQEALAPPLDGGPDTVNLDYVHAALQAAIASMVNAQTCFGRPVGQTGKPAGANK